MVLAVPEGFEETPLGVRAVPEEALKRLEVPLPNGGSDDVALLDPVEGAAETVDKEWLVEPAGVGVGGNEYPYPYPYSSVIVSDRFTHGDSQPIGVRDSNNLRGIGSPRATAANAASRGTL